MARPAKKQAADPDFGPDDDRDKSGGPPADNTRRRFIRFLNEVYREWERDQDWSSLENE